MNLFDMHCILHSDSIAYKKFFKKLVDARASSARLCYYGVL